MIMQASVITHQLHFLLHLSGGSSPYTINYTKNGVAQPALNNYVNNTPVNTGNLAVNTTYVLTSVTDANGCLAQNLGTSILITVGSVPTTATLTGSGNACNGASSWISSVITGGAPPYTVNYTRNGVAQPADQQLHKRYQFRPWQFCRSVHILTE